MRERYRIESGMTPDGQSVVVFVGIEETTEEIRSFRKLCGIRAAKLGITPFGIGIACVPPKHEPNKLSLEVGEYFSGRIDGYIIYPIGEPVKFMAIK